MKFLASAAFACLLALFAFGCAGQAQSVKSFSWSYPAESEPGEGLIEVHGVADGVAGTVSLDVATPVAAQHIECKLVVGDVQPPGMPVQLYDKHGSYGAFAFGYTPPDGIGASLVSAKVTFGNLIQCVGEVESALAESIIAALKPPVPAPVGDSSAAPPGWPPPVVADLDAFGEPDAQ